METLFSTSVSVLAVIAASIAYEVVTDFALVPSCARVIVNASVDMAVTRTISAFEAVGSELAGYKTALNGTDGNLLPSPLVTCNEVPDVAGEGAVATRLAAKFA